MRKSEIPGRNTIILTKKRIYIISVAFILFASLLLLNLAKLQIINNEYYKNKIYDQITTTAPLKAKRGNIYDSNMTLLATTKTDWRIFISTKDIKKIEKETNRPYSKIISTGLSAILGISETYLFEKIKNTNVLDVTIKKSANEEEYKAVLEFIRKNSLERLVFTEAQSKRYYPNGTLFAHVLGFTGSDSQGLYGLEYFYDDVLKGKNGYYLYAKDANGNALDTEYSSYYPATDGYNLVTTVDSYVQEQLESQLEAILVNHNVQNRVTGIVMNTETGAILGMATSSPFNPNEPYILDSISEEKLAKSGFAVGSEEYKKYRRELMEIMWSNKAVSETYEPGSTFKIVTVSAALDSGVASVSDRFSCHGFYQVGGWRIKCHKTTGHGSGFTLAYGLQMSCNPTMMQISERIGSKRFYEYIENFGYFEKSGIDLPSEAGTIFHKPENIGPTELATISFGQRFKVSVINHLTAISAIANGGNLVTPYVVEKIIDNDNNVIYEHQPQIKRSVVSEEVATCVASVLEEGVSGDGGAKNAYVEGYKIAAKTGTSQKFDILDENGNSYLRIGSTVAFAPSDQKGGISVIIVVDEPTTSVKYGSVVAAPYVSALMEKILPYLNYESTEEKINIEVDNYVGMPLEAAKNALKEKNLGYEVIGDGDIILSQTPNSEDNITSKNSKIILYTIEKDELIRVPSLVGETLESATEIAINSGLNISISGSFGGEVVSQSLPVGALVKRGTVVNIKTIVLDYED